MMQKKLVYLLIFLSIELLAFFKPLLAAEPYTNAQNPQIPNPIPPTGKPSVPLPTRRLPAPSGRRTARVACERCLPEWR